MRVEIFGITIATAKRVRKRLTEGMLLGKNESHPKVFGYVLGVYDSRIFGICIYRNLGSSEIKI